LSRLFDIEVIDDKIILSNLYSEKSFHLSEFDNITTTGFTFIIPLYPSSPPFFNINLKNGKKFMFQTLRNYTIFTSGKKKAEQLTSEIRYFIKRD